MAQKLAWHTLIAIICNDLFSLLSSLQWCLLCSAIASGVFFITNFFNEISVLPIGLTCLSFVCSAAIVLLFKNSMQYWITSGWDTTYSLCQQRLWCDDFWEFFKLLSTWKTFWRNCRNTWCLMGHIFFYYFVPIL